MNNLQYWVKRKRYQIKNLIKYVPFIWKMYDFDVIYGIRLFQMYLEDLATRMESESAMTVSAKDRASRIRTAIKLIDNVYETEKYLMEYQNVIESLYGKNAFDLCFDDFNIQFEFEKWENSEEIYNKLKVELDKSVAKHNKAKKLLWDFIGKNIDSWWD